MKKLFLLSFISLASTAVSLAQVKVLPNGNVGVGNSNPTKLFTVGSTEQFQVLSAGYVRSTDGSYASPTYSFTGLTNTGMFRSGTNKLGFATSGVERITIDNYGNVGINTTSPNNLLQVAGLINFNDNIFSTFLGKQAGTNSTGSYNTATGFNALYSNTSGVNNTISGYQSGYSNTTGYANTFTGGLSGYSNTTGYYNTFTGYQSGKNNTASNNTFVGYQAGYNNTIGANNTFIGTAGALNTTGDLNTFIGNVAGHKNRTGDFNTFTGYKAGYYNTTGSYNTFYGDFAGYHDSITGSNNTFIGYGADENGQYSNATAIGSGAIAQNTNYVRIGNTAVTTAWVNVAWTIGSDGRFKFNVQENVKGLEFINKLRPVTYQMNTQQLDNFVIQNMPDSIKIMHQAGTDFAPSTAIIHSGFIAQEVDSAAVTSGFTSSIVHTPSNSTDIYGLSYEEFVVPLVKAVQELNATITQQGLEIQALKARLDECCKVAIPATGN